MPAPTELSVVVVPPGGQRPGRPVDPGIDWRTWYESRSVSADQAIQQSVRTNDSIWISVGQRVTGLLNALVGRLDEVAPIYVTCVPTDNLDWYTPEVADRMGMAVVFATPLSSGAINDRRADFRPWWVYGAHKAFDEDRPGARPLDVVPISVRPPNEHGYCRLGSWVWDAKETAMKARTVIAVVNDKLPRTFGDVWVHVSDIDWFVEDTEPMPGRYPFPEPAPWDQAIADNVASLVRDGDTLQIGTGAVTANLMRVGAFDEKNDLGWFSELTTPGTIDRVRSGIITSRYMTTHPGKVVNTTAGNSPEDIEFIDDNPMFEFYSTEYMHNPICIARNDNFVAINSAISVDLTGQIAASHIGTSLYSGTGGQFSYSMGAFMSKGGRSITAMPSTARGGTVSRIAVHFVEGQIVTVPRDIADIVVTEFGIAHLLNKSQRERAAALIRVAHPDFRDELREQATRLFGA